MSETEQVVDVVVVGAGPTGLTVAGDLARAGRRVVVLERRPRISGASRAFATMARTLELLDARGVTDRLLAVGERTPSVTLFAGVRLDLAGLPTRFPFALVTPQVNVDTALAGYAEGHGAQLRRGVEVVAVEQDGDGVVVTARAGDDAVPMRWRASFVVAADGAHSTLRRLLGVPFPGRAVLRSVVLADVVLAAGPTGPGLTLGDTPDGIAFLAPYGRRDERGAWFRSMTWDRDHQVPDTVPVDEQEVERVLTRSTGRDLGLVEVGWRSRFHCEERQVRRYRHGRVFLAGDAAHVHSPVGGQGMNTGIQDAVNLAWKLDAVLGGAPDAVLDSYQAERHPVGRRVVRHSGLLMRAVTLHPRPARWLRDRIGTAVVGTPRVAAAVAGSFAGTGLRYPRRHGDHRAVGTRAETIELEGTTLAALQRDGGFVLALERDAPAVSAVGVTVARRTGPGPAVLVRPDGYVAWAGASAAAGGAGWRAALERWTGARAAYARRP